MYRDFFSHLTRFAQTEIRQKISIHDLLVINYLGQRLIPARGGQALMAETIHFPHYSGIIDL